MHGMVARLSQAESWQDSSESFSVEGEEFKAAPEFKVHHVDFLGPFSQWAPSVFGAERPSWADCPSPPGPV